MSVKNWIGLEEKIDRKSLQKIQYPPSQYRHSSLEERERDRDVVVAA